MAKKIVFPSELKEMYDVLKSAVKHEMKRGLSRKEACDEIRKELGIEE